MAQAASSGLIRATSTRIAWAASHKSTARCALSQNSGELPKRRANRSAISGYLRDHRPAASLWPWLWWPRLSAKTAEASAFMLTPSCLARATKRAWMLRGTRAINFPLGNSPSCGISRPASRATVSHAATASRPLAIASSGVSPSDIQPGRSGKVISQPPPEFPQGLWHHWH